MGSRTQDECILHFACLPIEVLEDPEHGAEGGIGSGDEDDGEEEEKENIR